MKLSTWHEVLYDCEQKGLGYVLVTVIRSAGSTPRDAGTKMILTDDSQFDTVGGGHLEYEAVSKARELLAKGDTCQEIISYPLSSKLGQCCGGAVKLLFEVMVSHQQHIAVFGAGHVAQALVPILAQLPLQISWIDSRENFFDMDSEISNSRTGISTSNLGKNAQKIANTYSNVKAIMDDEPCGTLKTLPENAWIVILTHNHQLDYELVETALKHPNLDYIGMIGSHTKAKRFTTKLKHRGFNNEQISRLVSPIGDLSITGKRPIEVAVSISSQIMGLMQKIEQTSSAKQLTAPTETNLLKALSLPYKGDEK